MSAGIKVIAPFRCQKLYQSPKYFRLASQNCRWQGEKSREYFVYFKIF